MMAIRLLDLLLLQADGAVIARWLRCGRRSRLASAVSGVGLAHALCATPPLHIFTLPSYGHGALLHHLVIGGTCRALTNRSSTILLNLGTVSTKQSRARGGRAPRVSTVTRDGYRRQRLRTAGCFLLARYRPTMHSTAVVMLRMI